MLIQHDGGGHGFAYNTFRAAVRHPGSSASPYILTDIPLAGKTNMKDSRNFKDVINQQLLKWMRYLLHRFDVLPSFIPMNVSINEAVQVIYGILYINDIYPGREIDTDTRQNYAALRVMLEIHLLQLPWEHLQAKRGYSNELSSLCCGGQSMEFFEELVLKSAPSSLQLWKRNVDDTC